MGLLPVSMAVSANSRFPLLQLWTEGHAGGYLLLRRGRVLDAHMWGDPWLTVLTDDAADQLVPPVGDAAVLSARFARPPEAQVALRALLRRDVAAPAALAELLELLAAPLAAVEVLTGATDPATLPGACRPEPRSLAQALRDARHGLPGEPRWVGVLDWAKYAVPAVIFALLVAAGASVVATDGGSGQDYAAMALIAVLAVPCAVLAWRVRRRRSR